MTSVYERSCLVLPRPQPPVPAEEPVRNTFSLVLVDVRWIACQSRELVNVHVRRERVSHRLPVDLPDRHALARGWRQQRKGGEVLLSPVSLKTSEIGVIRRHHQLALVAVLLQGRRADGGQPGFRSQPRVHGVSKGGVAGPVSKQPVPAGVLGRDRCGRAANAQDERDELADRPPYLPGRSPVVRAPGTTVYRGRRRCAEHKIHHGPLPPILKIGKGRQKTTGTKNRGKGDAGSWSRAASRLHQLRQPSGSNQLDVRAGRQRKRFNIVDIGCNDQVLVIG